MSKQFQDLIKVEKDLHSWILHLQMQLRDYDQALSSSVKLIEQYLDDWKFYEIFVSCLFEKYADS